MPVPFCYVGRNGMCSLETYVFEKCTDPMTKAAAPDLR